MEKVVLHFPSLFSISSTHRCSLQYYQVRYSPEHNLKSTPSDPDKADEQKKKFEFAEKNFEPLYFIRSYPSDKKKMEMSFDLTVYQPQVSFVFRT